MRRKQSPDYRSPAYVIHTVRSSVLVFTTSEIAFASSYNSYSRVVNSKWKRQSELELVCTSLWGQTSRKYEHTRTHQYVHECDVVHRLSLTFVRDAPVAVLVRLADQLVEFRFRHQVVDAAQHEAQLAARHVADAVGVEDAERLARLLVRVAVLHHLRHHAKKLGEVHWPAACNAPDNRCGNRARPNLCDLDNKTSAVLLTY